MRALAIFALLAASVANAQPFLVADVTSGVTSCGVYMDAAPKVTVAASGTQCKYDVAGIAAGSHTVKMTAITANDPIWGTQESAPSAPFTFARPATPAAPTGLVLSP